MATAANPPTPYASASLYVGDLASDVTEALLFEMFNAVGPVASVRVCRDAATRRSLGYAYVNFHRVDDAERALDTMNFKMIRNKPCRIMWSHRDPSLRKSGLGNIFVKNLAKSIDNKSLYDTFSMFGNILSCKVAMNSKRESCGYGFVHYESEEAANNAILRVNGKVIADKTVEVQAFKAKSERPAKFNFTNVFVKNLPTEKTTQDLEKMFSKFGKITSSVIVSGEDGKSRGFGFVNFETPEEAKAAIAEMNDSDVGGEKKLYVARAQKKAEREKELREKFEQYKAERQKKYAGVNLYVKNLADTMDDERLKEEFKKFGDITSARVMQDGNSKSRGFGFICFSSPDEATKAVTEMNGRMVDNKPLYVALAQRKEVRRAHLEAQHAARAKLGIPQPQMYPPQGAPMFYQGGMPQRAMVYPQQMVPRRWNPSQPTPHMMARGQLPNQYSLMPMQNNRGAGGPGGPSQRNRRDRRGNNQQPNQQQPNQQPVKTAQPPQAMPAAQAEPLTIKALAAAPENQQKQMIGERLFPLINQKQPTLAGKITGMLLEMDNGELIHLIESEQALNDKIREAIQVLEAHGAATE